MLYCQNTANRLSYTSNLSAVPKRDNQPIVAILTAPSSADGFVMPWVDDGKFVTTLAALGSPPQELNLLDFVFKSHPRFDISSLLEKVIRAPNLLVWPPEAPVTELLEKAWVIVICNHYGSVVAEAVATGKPIIFLDSAHYFYPNVQKSAFKAGEVVEDGPTLWELLRCLRDSMPFYEKLKERCQLFRSQYFQPSDLTLAQQLVRLENKRVGVA